MYGNYDAGPARSLHAQLLHRAIKHTQQCQQSDADTEIPPLLLLSVCLQSLSTSVFLRVM